jgi:hypothetical protein
LILAYIVQTVLDSRKGLDFSDVIGGSITMIIEMKFGRDKMEAKKIK